MTADQTPANETLFSLDNLDHPHAELCLMLASAIGHLLSEDAAAVIVANHASALELVLVNPAIENAIDGILSGPPIPWHELSVTRRWAGIIGAGVLAQALSIGAVEHLLEAISPERRSEWVRAISPGLVRP